MSRELAADASNSVSLIESTIASALAARVDWLALRGTGSGMPLGLLSMSGVNTAAISGAWDYADLLTGLMEIESDNFYPNAYIASPANHDVLRKLLVATEANHYAVAPPAVAALMALSTSACPDATAVMGDFSKFLIGLRQAPTIEVSTDAGDAFEKHMVYIKITWRGTFATEHRTAFHTMTAIS